jgi:hypothetical protein
MSKRITVAVDKNIDSIQDYIYENTGVRMSYVQVIDHLIHFYIKNGNVPKTKWAPIARSKDD